MEKLQSCPSRRMSGCSAESELIGAGEKFEAVNLYAKTTGKGPGVAGKYVDKITNA